MPHALPQQVHLHGRDRAAKRAGTSTAQQGTMAHIHSDVVQAKAHEVIPDTGGNIKLIPTSTSNTVRESVTCSMVVSDRHGGMES